MYVYIESERWQDEEDYSWHYLYTVGFYDPQGKWQPESDHDNQEAAAKRVHYLNGGREG